MRRDAPDAPPSPATQGMGTQIVATPIPTTSKEDERNLPAAFVELIGPDGSLGTWLVSPELPMPQRFTSAGHEWKLAMRFERRYLPFSLTLLKFSHDIFPGTNIDRNFSSRVRLNSPGGTADREVLIYMNNPLRTGGLTFYQKSFVPANDVSEERTTVLQVVSNPSWRIPYIACGMMALGLVLQFGLHLSAFFGRRRRTVDAASRRVPISKRGEDAASTFIRVLTPLQRFVPWLALACGLCFLVSKIAPSSNPGAFDVTGFGRLPTLNGGRIKPFDSVARSALLQLQARQRVAIDDKTSITPDEWLLDVFFRPEKADTYDTFVIDNPDLLSLVGKSDEDVAIHYPDRAHQLMAVMDMPGFPSRRRRFSYQEIAPYLDAIDAQAKLAEPVDDKLRNPFQRAVLQLAGNLALYQRLEHTLQIPGRAISWAN